MLFRESMLARQNRGNKHAGIAGIVEGYKPNLVKLVYHNRLKPLFSIEMDYRFICCGYIFLTVKKAAFKDVATYEKSLSQRQFFMCALYSPVMRFFLMSPFKERFFYK